MARAPKPQREASVEIQRRLSFPFACISFALAGHADRRAPPAWRPRRRLPDHTSLDHRLLPDVHDWNRTRAPGNNSYLGRHLVGERNYGGLGLFLLPRLERMPGSSRTDAALAWVRRWRVWKIFSRRRAARSAGSERLIRSEQDFCQKKRPDRDPSAPGRVSPCAASSITSFC